MKSRIKWLAIYMIGLLASCSAEDALVDKDVVKGGDRMVVALSGEEALSLVAGNSYTLSDKEVLDIVNNFSTTSENDGSQTRTAATFMSNLQVIGNYKLACNNELTARESAPQDSVEFCQVRLGEKDTSGMAIVCRDSRYPEVLAYIPNVDIHTIQTFEPVQMMIERAQTVALKYISKCNSLVKDRRGKTLEKVCKTLNISEKAFNFEKYRSQIFVKDYDSKSLNSATTPTGTILSTVGPLCGTTRIIQGWPCNQFIPETTLDAYNTEQHNGHYPAGCVNVALATICSYLQPTIYCSDLGRNINWDSVCNTYFNPYGFNPSQYSSATAQAIEVGNLLKIMADGTKTSFSAKGGSTTTPNAATYMRSIGVSMRSSTSTLNYANVRSSLSNLSLVYCTGTMVSTTKSDGTGNGHAWVIDGLQIRKPQARMELQNYNCYANCKFGWIEWEYQTTYNGWYLFDTDGSITFDFDSEALSTKLACIPNIRLK